MTTFDQVPSDVSCVDPDNVSATTNAYGQVSFSLSGKDGKPIGGSHVTVIPSNFGTPPASSAATPSWTMGQMLNWYQVLYGQTGLEVLQYYQQGQNLITPTHFLHNWTIFRWAVGGKTWDLNYYSRTDNKVEIQIETNLTPVAAAQALYEALQASIGKPSVRGNIPLDDQHLDLLLQGYRQAGVDAVALGRSAADAYMAGIQIASEPANFFVSINEAADGHYGAALLNLLPYLVPTAVSLGKKAFTLAFKDSSFVVGVAVAKALADVKTLGTIEERMAAIEQAAAADGTVLTPELRITIANSDALADVAKIGKSTGADLARNLEAAGIAKPASTYQAHHDLPQFFRNFFVGHGLDIDKAEYGRWVAPGWHQSFTPEFNAQWQQFINKESQLGRCYTKDEILAQMNNMRADLRFRQNPPLH